MIFITRLCEFCNQRVEHLKKHIKKAHPEEFKKKYILPLKEKKEVKRPHTCPVVYLQNFARVSPNYLKKNFTVKTYRPPKRDEFLIYAHDKISNSIIFNTSLHNVSVRKDFYTNKVENYLRKLETNVGKQFRKIRNMSISTFIDPYPVFRFAMSQLIRTPKFQEKIKKDLIYLKNMEEEDFNQSLMKYFLVQKPTEVTEASLNRIHEDFILNNTLETIYKWSTITLITNNTNIPFITSESPVVYNQAEFLPSYLPSVDRIEFSMIFNANTTFYFPIDPKFAIMINKFDNTRTDAVVNYEDVFTEELIMTINMLEYQYAEKFVYLENINEELIRRIRHKCGNKLNTEYQCMEFSYNMIKKEAEERLKLTNQK